MRRHIVPLPAPRPRAEPRLVPRRRPHRPARCTLRSVGPALPYSKLRLAKPVSPRGTPTLLRLMETHPAPAVERAVTAALERHSPRLETVRLILRQQQAGPPSVCPPVAGVGHADYRRLRRRAKHRHESLSCSTLVPMPMDTTRHDAFQQSPVGGYGGPATRPRQPHLRDAADRTPSRLQPRAATACPGLPFAKD